MFSLKIVNILCINRISFISVDNIGGNIAMFLNNKSGCKLKLMT